MNLFISLLALVASTPAFAADPCKPFKADEGNAVLNDTRGLHNEECFARIPGAFAMNNRDAFTGGGQPQVIGDYEATNAAYVVLVNGRPLHQWLKQRATDPLPGGAVIIEAPFAADTRGTEEVGDDFTWLSVGVAVDAPANILSLIGARDVKVAAEESVITIKAASAMLPMSVENLIFTDFVGELTVYKLFRKGDSQVFGYVGKKTITVDTQVHPGFILHMTAQGGWAR